MGLTQPIRDPAQVRAFVKYYIDNGQYRNYVLVNIAIYTALRIGDILNLRCRDVFDFENHCAHDTVTIIEQKTGKHKTIALHQNIKEALGLYFRSSAPGPYTPLILNKNTGASISRIQANRIFHESACAVGIPHKVTCHSLRKTFGFHSWQNGVSPVLLMEIFNHSSYSITRRYLGVTQDDKNAVYRNLII